MSRDSLSGRGSGYRDVAIRCPGCAAAMRQLALEKAESEVDVCDECGGLWVDWFDGEVCAIATETMTAKAIQPLEPADEKRPRVSANEAVALGACPRCTRHLVAERYIASVDTPGARWGVELETSRGDGRRPLEGAPPRTTATGAELLRCEDCMGSFVSRTSAEILSWLGTQDDKPPPSESVGVLEPLPWQRFTMMLKRVLGFETRAKRKGS